MEPRATIDFETRSACELKDCGSWKYSLDPTTQILCLAYRLPHWPAGKTGLWTPGFRQFEIPEGPYDADCVEFFQWIVAGRPVEAHSAFFERCIWRNILVPRHGWPALDGTQLSCSAAKAAAMALPRALEDAGAALGLRELKDEAGSKVMKKMAKPRKPRKKERELWAFRFGKNAPHKLLWWESADMFAQLFAYCRQDVLAEAALSEAIPDLNYEETVLYQIDQTVNERGFQVDMDAVDTALSLVQREVFELNNELSALTNGAVERATMRARLLKWLASDADLVLFDTQKETIDDTLKTQELTPLARRTLEILRTLGRSSTAKYEAMFDWASPADERVRGGLLFHGATTGRWSGSGVQPHNFPKGTLKEKDMGRLWSVLKTRDRAKITEAYGSVMEALSHGLRGAIVAPAGRQLYVADYAAIEARVVLWLADDQGALDIFRQHKDIYLDMAESIYGYPCTKDGNPKERGIGKIAILGLGYQMGASKFVGTCEKGGVIIDETFGQSVVDAYRLKYWRVKQMWWDQQNAAINAVLSGRRQECGYVTWFVQGSFLYCELPSGRRLAYPFPKVSQKMTPWGEMRPVLTFMGVDSHTHQWTRQHTYGGMLVENITQAVARDIMAEAMVRCEASGIYDPILTVHDELVCEADLGQGSVEHFVQLISEVPEWAPGCPVEAEGWAGERYRK